MHFKNKSVGRISAMAGGIACGIVYAVCAGMGWEQKAVVWVQGIGVCYGVRQECMKEALEIPLQYQVDWLVKLQLKVQS